MKHTIKTISNEYLMSCTNALTFPLFHLSTLTQLPILNIITSLHFTPLPFPSLPFPSLLTYLILCVFIYLISLRQNCTHTHADTHKYVYVFTNIYVLYIGLIIRYLQQILCVLDNDYDDENFGDYITIIGIILRKHSTLKLSPIHV
jgi:hypothetical protein